MPDGLSEFIETIRIRELMDGGAGVFVGRAPGRLDVMGGIADYSGSLVLQRPISEATFAGCQLTGQSTIEMISIGRRPVSVPVDSLVSISYPEAQQLFHQNADDQWAAYVGGVLVALLRERDVCLKDGAKIVVASAVPEGKGVASSAALEVAVMYAVTAAFNIAIDPHDMALLCQKAENLVAGAPCGVMDQMAAVFGESDALMALLCQPAKLQPSVKTPEGIAFWGIDSGEGHSVSGSDYESVRTGTFMGRRLIAEIDSTRDDYLANISPADFERDFRNRLPEEMSGDAFLARYSQTADTVTKVQANRVYKIRQPTEHPIFENDRVQRFRKLLESSIGEGEGRELGELMFQSHASYSKCGLGSHGTDLIVKLVREAADDGLYGARITGGGSGGTVAVLGRRDAGRTIKKIVDEYTNATGYRPHVFAGSSGGAAKFGTRRQLI